MTTRTADLQPLLSTAYDRLSARTPRRHAYVPFGPNALTLCGLLLGHDVVTPDPGEPWDADDPETACPHCQAAAKKQ